MASVASLPLHFYAGLPRHPPILGPPRTLSMMFASALAPYANAFLMRAKEALATLRPRLFDGSSGSMMLSCFTTIRRPGWSGRGGGRAGCGPGPGARIQSGPPPAPGSRSERGLQVAVHL